MRGHWSRRCARQSERSTRGRSRDRADAVDARVRDAAEPDRGGGARSLGMLGLVLATFGLAAIIAYNVSRRTGEIAIRSALGATRGRIVSSVIRDAALLVTTGVMLGLGLAAFVTQPLAAWLVTGLSATDPLSFIGTAAVFVAVSVLASWILARQATRVSPVIAMRLIRHSERSTEGAEARNRDPPGRGVSPAGTSAIPRLRPSASGNDNAWRFLAFARNDWAVRRTSNPASSKCSSSASTRRIRRERITSKLTARQD